MLWHQCASCNTCHEPLSHDRESEELKVCGTAVSSKIVL